ncbi:MAG: LDL receptor domain-containing protein [Polyangiaceae bacterium]
MPKCPKQADVVAKWLNSRGVCVLRSLAHQLPSDFSYVYQCRTGESIQPSTVCNGIQDCPDGDDEEGCPVACELTCTSNGLLTTCGGPPCEFFCADGSKILQDEICDGVDTCPGGEDELCVDRFTCYLDPERSGVDFAKLCDGKADCPKGEDESTCPPKTQFFICDDGNEILFPYFTAGCFKRPYPREPRCSDGSAPYLPCPNPR